MSQIMCFSKSDNALILESVGVSVIIDNNEDNLKDNIKKSLNNDVKILLIDEDIQELIIDIKEKYDDVAFPIFISLPFKDKPTGKSLNEMKKSIEKAIGISVF